VPSEPPAAEILRLLRRWREAERTKTVVSRATDNPPTIIADLTGAIFRAYPSEAQWQAVWGNWEGLIRPCHGRPSHNAWMNLATTTRAVFVVYR
jgi:hypothetical protein